jgi:uncharacterized protein YbaR (Trm112 family)
MIEITCTSCQKLLSIDENKLPMHAVALTCPVCKAKLSVDRRDYEPAQAAPPAEVGEDTNAFGAKALIVGNDHPALRQAAKQIGFVPAHFADAKQARDYFTQELPPLVILHPAQMTAPPLEAMAPIVSLAPADRRKAFFILVAENLRTLDGNAAFLYGVNLVVATKDLGAMQQIYREAFGYHERLYGAMKMVMKEFSSTH